MRRLWVWLFGEHGYGFVELLVLTLVALIASALVLAAIGFVVAFIWTLAAPLLGLR